MPTLAEKWQQEGIAIGLEKGREEGLVEGREEGKREATLKILKRFLAHCFSIDLDHFTHFFEECDLPTLTRLSDIAFEVETWSDFESKLNEVTSDNNGNLES